MVSADVSALAIFVVATAANWLRLLSVDIRVVCVCVSSRSRLAFDVR